MKGTLLPAGSAAAVAAVKAARAGMKPLDGQMQVCTCLHSFAPLSIVFEVKLQYTGAQQAARVKKPCLGKSAGFMPVTSNFCPGTCKVR